MKRNSFLLIGLFFVGVLVVLGSCKKKEATALEFDTSRSATVSGIVYAQLDLVNDFNGDGDFEFAPSGTKLIATVANDEYIDGAEGSKVYEATVGSSGTYSFSIPATNEGVDIDIILVDFEYDQVQADYDSENDVWVADGTERKIYTVDGYSPSLITGDIKVRDFYYDAN